MLNHAPFGQSRVAGACAFAIGCAVDETLTGRHNVGKVFGVAFRACIVTRRVERFAITQPFWQTDRVEAGYARSAPGFWPRPQTS